MPPINTGDRKELGKLLQSLAAGNQVVAARIDRLARSMFELLAIVLLQCRDFKCEPTVDFLFVF